MVRSLLGLPSLSQENDLESGELQSHHRKELLSILTTEVSFDENTGPLMAVLPRYIASFYRLLTQESQKLEVPSY